MAASDSFVGEGLNPSPYKEALARAERAEAERDTLLKDAERYRWIRNHPMYLGWEHDFMPSEIDADVDESMAKDAALVKGEG